jgi:hypothetical protein
MTRLAKVREGAMNWVITKMKWLMLLSGALTCTMVYAVVAPKAALRSLFGEALEGPLAELIVRNWGTLITLIGVMLIYGAFNLQSRPLVLAVASLSKFIFIALVFVYTLQYPGFQAGFTLAIDSVMVVIFVGYLVAVLLGSRLGQQQLSKDL